MWQTTKRINGRKYYRTRNGWNKKTSALKFAKHMRGLGKNINARVVFEDGKYYVYATHAMISNMVVGD